MNVAHIFSGNPHSGAASGAINLCKGLIDEGLNLKLFNDQFNFFIENKEIKFALNKLKFVKSVYYNSLDRLFFFGKKKIKLSSGILKNSSLNINELNKFDIVHLHWINNGFFDLNNLSKIDVPIIWTVRDMWPFTGGCHYTAGCEKFFTECKNCPNFSSYITNFDSINKVFERKKKIFDSVEINFVTISKWLTNELKKSELLKTKKVTQIYNCIDYDVFTPKNILHARKNFSLPAEKFIILIGSQKLNDKFKDNLKILDILKNLDEKFQIVTFGKNKIKDKRIINLGYIKEKNILSDLYSAANIFLTFSKQEAFGKTIVESLRCGTPVVSNFNFSSGEIITHKKNGYLVRNDNYLEAINWIKENLNKNRDNFNIKIENNFSISNISKKYIELYKKLLKK